MTYDRNLALIEKRMDELQVNQARLEKKISDLHEMLTHSIRDILKRINEKDSFRNTDTPTNDNASREDGWRIISFNKKDERMED